jgi:hypothetical protein
MQGARPVCVHPADEHEGAGRGDHTEHWTHNGGSHVFFGGGGLLDGMGACIRCPNEATALLEMLHQAHMHLLQHLLLCLRHTRGLSSCCCLWPPLCVVTLITPAWSG